MYNSFRVKQQGGNIRARWTYFASLTKKSLTVPSAVNDACPCFRILKEHYSMTHSYAMIMYAGLDSLIIIIIIAQI